MSNPAKEARIGHLIEEYQQLMANLQAVAILHQGTFESKNVIATLPDSRGLIITSSHDRFVISLSALAGVDGGAISTTLDGKTIIGAHQKTAETVEPAILHPVPSENWLIRSEILLLKAIVETALSYLQSASH